MTVHTMYARGRGREDLTVLDWRRERLEQAGFEGLLAARLAETPEVDLHELLDLVHRGCPPRLAERILSPLPGVQQ